MQMFPRVKRPQPYCSSQIGAHVKGQNYHNSPTYLVYPGVFNTVRHPEMRKSSGIVFKVQVQRSKHKSLANPNPQTKGVSITYFCIQLHISISIDQRTLLLGKVLFQSWDTAALRQADLGWEQHFMTNRRLLGVTTCLGMVRWLFWVRCCISHISMTADRKSFPIFFRLLRLEVSH